MIGLAWISGQFLWSSQACGQDSTSWSGGIQLQEIILMAQTESLDAEKAENRKENSYWSFRRIQSLTKPNLNLRGQALDFTRTIDAINQDDGSQRFREIQNAYSDVDLMLNQNLPWTGGDVAVLTNLSRLQNFSDNSITYRSQPIAVTINQPLFSYNRWKWDKKIEPLKYDESQKQYKEDRVMIAYRTTRLFFDLLLAQVNLSIASKNKENSDINYKIGTGRYNLGKIAENELLELELNALNSERDMKSALLDVETSNQKLQAYIGASGLTILKLSVPDEIPDFAVDAATALNHARNNRQQYASFKRRLLEAESEVARAKSENTLDVNLRGRVGLIDRGETYREAYQELQSNQRYNIEVNIPILDWNRRKASYKTAIANERLIGNTIAQEEQAFETEIETLVKQLPILRSRVYSTKRGDEIAGKRYNISQERYLVANISVTDLNLALKAKDEAKRAYLMALREYWTAYQELRLLTLYDFENNTPIQF